MIDPNGAPEVSPEEVELMTYDENKRGLWASFHLQGEGDDPANHRGLMGIAHQQLDVSIEKSANLQGKSVATIVAHRDGVRVIPFRLFSSLRVSSVTGPDGQGIGFIQEDKNDDADFRVILPEFLSAGQKYSVTIDYGGKEAVMNTGGGNYFPVAHDDWYPNSSHFTLGEYAAYDVTFRKRAMLYYDDVLAFTLIYFTMKKSPPSAHHVGWGFICVWTFTSLNRQNRHSPIQSPELASCHESESQTAICCHRHCS